MKSEKLPGIFRKIPKDWEVKSLGEFTEEVNKRYSKDLDGPVLSVTKYRGFVRSDEYFKKRIFSKDIKNYKLVEKNDFAYATIHLDEGSIGILKELKRGYISPMYTVFRIKSSLNGDFLYDIMKTDSYISKYSSLGEGSIKRRKSISYEKLSQLQFAYPKLAEQKRIITVFENTKNFIGESKKSLEKLKILRKGIVDTLMRKGIKQKKMISISKTQKIPEDWDYVQLKEIADRSDHSFTDGPFGSNLKVSEYTDKGIPVIQLANIGEGFFKPKNFKYISEKKFQELKKHVVFPNYIVISKMPDPIGRSCLVSNYYKKYIIVADCIKLKVNEEIAIPSFVSTMINSRIVRRHLEMLSVGSGRKRINLTDLKKSFIPLPKIKEQEEISKIITNIDLKIQNQNHYVLGLKDLEKGIKQKLLSGQIRV